MVGLGGKASVTSRGTTIKSFIKNGKQYVYLILLKNFINKYLYCIWLGIIWKWYRPEKKFTYSFLNMKHNSKIAWNYMKLLFFKQVLNVLLVVWSLFILVWVEKFEDDIKQLKLFFFKEFSESSLSTVHTNLIHG